MYVILPVVLFTYHHLPNDVQVRWKDRRNQYSAICILWKLECSCLQRLIDALWKAWRNAPGSASFSTWWTAMNARSWKMGPPSMKTLCTDTLPRAPPSMPKVDPRTLSLFWVMKLVCCPWGQGLEYPLCWHETSGLVAVGKQCLCHHLGKTVGWSHTNTTDDQRLVHVVKWQHQESRVPSVVWMWLAESLCIPLQTHRQVKRMTSWSGEMSWFPLPSSSVWQTRLSSCMLEQLCCHLLWILTEQGALCGGVDNASNGLQTPLLCPSVGMLEQAKAPIWCKLCMVDGE